MPGGRLPENGQQKQLSAQCMSHPQLAVELVWYSAWLDFEPCRWEGWRGKRCVLCGNAVQVPSHNRQATLRLFRAGHATKTGWSIIFYVINKQNTLFKVFVVASVALLFRRSSYRLDRRPCGFVRRSHLPAALFALATLP